MANTNNNDVCASQYREQVSQRTQLQLFQSVVPPVRLEVSNPYVAQPELTPFDMAMRRKFDVLQYRGTAGSNVYGGATARQQYIRLARGGMVVARRIAPQSLVDARYTVCDIANPMPVGSSGVPRGGDTDVLYLDPAVPQYMYSDPRLDRNYTEYADLPADPFAVYYSAQTPMSTIDAAWATMRLSTAGGRAARRFRMRLAVSLAVIVTGTTTATTTTTVAISVEPRTMHLYYNDTAVANSVAPSSPMQLTLQIQPAGNGGGGGSSSSSSSSSTFSVAVYVETLVADLSVFCAADTVAVFTARVDAGASVVEAASLPAGVTATAGVVAHLPSNWADIIAVSNHGASLAPSAGKHPLSSSVVLLNDDDA